MVFFNGALYGGRRLALAMLLPLANSEGAFHAVALKKVAKESGAES